MACKISIQNSFKYFFLKEILVAKVVFLGNNNKIISYEKTKTYTGDSTFITVFENGYHLINNGYYVIRAYKGTAADAATANSENVLIKINSDYYLFEMNDEVKKNTAFFDNLKRYNQISLRNISKEEYDSYSN